jgi:hypothetical protein
MVGPELRVFQFLTIRHYRFGTTPPVLSARKLNYSD